MIHRSFLVKSFEEPEVYGFTRQTCTRAAMTILHEFHRVKETDIVKLWIIPTFTVGAAVVLYLDLHYKKRRGEVVDLVDVILLQDTVSALERMNYDHNAARGVRMLENLVAQLDFSNNQSNWESLTSHDDLAAYLVDNAAWH